MMVYADKFYKPTEQTTISATFTEQEKIDDGSINMNTVIISNNENEQGVLKYIVQPGDSLGKIASQFGTTVSHIQRINHLKNKPIRPGQELIITEEEGFIYTIDAKINVAIFADKYNLNVEDVMTLNYIQDKSEMLQEGQELFLNLSMEQAYQAGLLERPKPKPVITYKPTSRTPAIRSNTIISTPAAARSTSSRSSSNSDSDIIAQWTFNKPIKNQFYAGHCTWYAAIITPEIFPYIDENTQSRPFGGNANQWYANAKAAGFEVGKTPRVGALIVYNRGYRWASAGHVGKVISYMPDEGRMIIRDMNRLGKFIVTERYEDVNDANILGYIYP